MNGRMSKKLRKDARKAIRELREMPFKWRLLVAGFILFGRKHYR